jgi:Domain of unknown function (DUF4331)
VSVDAITRDPASAKRWVAGVVALLLVAGLAAAVLAPGSGNASSHREAPLIAADPQVDNTDLYAFRSPDKPGTVTLVGNWIPFEEPGGGPNFYPFATNARYDFHIDNDGDARADITYRFRFKNHYRTKDTFLYNTGPVTSLKDANLNFYQTYDLLKVVPGHDARTLLNDKKVVPSYVGKASMPNYAALRREGIASYNDRSHRAFAGQANDPFFLDIRVFDLLYGGDLSEVGDDSLRGFNVNTLALQIPRKWLAQNRNASKHPVVGVWTTTSRRSVTVRRPNGRQSFRGGYSQVSRLGNPLVNEVVIPVKDKDYWNASRPTDDGAFLEYVLEPEVPELIQAIYGIPAPDTCGNNNPPRCRTDLVDVFLKGVKGLNRPAGVVPSEQMRLNMGIPVCEPGSCGKYSRLGVIGGDLAGFPNGRRLNDDVVDIELQVLEGELLENPNDLGDAVDRDDSRTTARFPYVALPTSGSDPSPH